MSMVWGTDFVVENFSYFWPPTPTQKREKNTWKKGFFFQLKHVFLQQKIAISVKSSSNWKQKH